MKEIEACGQRGCDALAVARFTWPGRTESFICAEHRPTLEAVARALNLTLQVIDLESSE